MQIPYFKQLLQCPREAVVAEEVVVVDAHVLALVLDVHVHVQVEVDNYGGIIT